MSKQVSKLFQHLSKKNGLSRRNLDLNPTDDSLEPCGAIISGVYYANPTCTSNALPFAIVQTNEANTVTKPPKSRGLFQQKLR
mmetsp:Transcript_20815/g.23169  ORF Transcript_20815/g.23169 Transcript_20815/m.23169 type:complete len:83 (-) Transcript_20815:1160-1408(-)